MGRRASAEPEPKKQKKRLRRRRVVGLTVTGLVVTAVAQELSKPPGQRTWTGRVAGLVPYDLRWPPTAERFRAALWNPESEAFFAPHAFGVGWTVNFARVARLVDEATESAGR